jgi:hypothetical protein
MHEALEDNTKVMTALIVRQQAKYMGYQAMI